MVYSNNKEEMKLFVFVFLISLFFPVFSLDPQSVQIIASNLLGDIIADVSVPYVEGHDGFDYMLQGKDLKLFEMSHSFLGPFPVIAIINDERHDLRSTGWCLSYKTAEGKLYQNVGLKELKPSPGDKLIFKLLKMGTFPERDELYPSRETSNGDGEENGGDSEEEEL